MANVELATSMEQHAQILSTMDETQLAAQEVIQYGALHAIRHLIAIGCTTENATGMLANLEQASSAIYEGSSQNSENKAR